MQHNAVELLRKTESVCPQCLNKIGADIIIKNNKVFMVKDCKQHGCFEVLISNHSWYYKGLTDFFFSLIREPFIQKDFLLYLTDKCNLNCPICLNETKNKPINDLKFENIKEFLRGKKGFKFNLMGAEPTMREELAEFIKVINESGNRVALHTNGVKIADITYLDKLKKAGLKEVHLQFDGFDDQIYVKLRGQELLNIKLQALDNLKRLNIATHIKATIAKGVNEKEMVKILNFGIENNFIKEIGFLGMRFLGNARDFPYGMCILPDELIDLLQEQTNGKISRKAIFYFQKMYYVLLSIFSVRKCCYNQHFLVARNKKDYIPIDKIIDIESIGNILGKFNQFKKINRRIVLLYLFLNIFPKFLTLKGILFLKDFLLLKVSLISKFDLSKFPRGKILLSFITICDPYTIDYQIARNCCYGEISDDLGIQDSAILNFVRRQRQAIKSVNIQ